MSGYPVESFLKARRILPVSAAGPGELLARGEELAIIV